MATNAYCKRCGCNFDCHLTKAEERLTMSRDEKRIVTSRCTGHTKRSGKCRCPGWVPGG